MQGRGRQGQGRGRGCGKLRLTSARESILNILSKEKKHLSADELFSLARNVSPGIGLATIYRALEFLSNNGMIKKLDFGTGMSKYELKQETEEGYHQYIVCEICGKVFDHNCLDSQEVEMFKYFAKKVRSKYDFEIDLNRVQFYGVCSKCK